MISGDDGGTEIAAPRVEEARGATVATTSPAAEFEGEAEVALHGMEAGEQTSVRSFISKASEEARG
jgi:hypothetical protein